MRVALAITALIWGLSFAVACSSGSSSGSAPADAGGSEASVEGGGQPFAKSACGSCVAKACASVIAQCNGEPECANYWACVESCGVAHDGNVDPKCQAACPMPTGSAALVDVQQLTDCRTAGAGSTCAACGIDGGAQSPILGQTCPPGTDTAPCALCEDDHCCDTQQACLDDPECEAYSQCNKNCAITEADGGTFDSGLPDAGGLTCAQICYALHPAGVTKYAPRLACVFMYCSTASTCAPGLSQADYTCDSCLATNCANQYVNLFGTVDGYLLGVCFDGCGDQIGSPCADKCQAQYPTVSAAWNAYVTCSMNKCATQCQ